MSLPPSEIPLGAMRFNSDSQKLEYWNGSEWFQIHTFTPNLEGGARGVFFGRAEPTITDRIDYVNISNTGDAQDFGDLTEVKHNSSGLSSQTRGINAGGNPGSMSDVIAFVTIATTGDATDFGNLITGRQGPATASNSIRGLFASGVTPSNTNLIDFITIATTANASDFGDIDPVQTHFPEGCSDSHGGLS